MGKINQKLADIVTNGAQGNSQKEVDKLHYANSSKATQAIARHLSKSVYWPATININSYRIWHFYWPNDSGNLLPPILEVWSVSLATIRSLLDDLTLRFSACEQTARLQALTNAGAFHWMAKATPAYSHSCC